MPTYSMVPEAIKRLRRIPFIGNFMSFPAEIIRTSGNIVDRGLREMSFKALNEAGDSIIPGLTREQALRLQRLPDFWLPGSGPRSDSRRCWWRLA